MRVFAGGERDGWRQRAEREKWGKDTVWSESNRWMPVFYKQQEVIVVWLLIWPLKQHGQRSPYTHIRWSWLSYSKTFATRLLHFSQISAHRHDTLSDPAWLTPCMDIITFAKEVMFSPMSVCWLPVCQHDYTKTQMRRKLGWRMSLGLE